MHETTPVYYRTKKRIFLGLLLMTIFFLLLVIFYLFLFVSNPQALILRILIISITIPALFCILLFLGGLLAIVFTIFKKRTLPGWGWFIEKTLPFLFPIVIQLGRFLHITQDKIQRSFVEVNNQLVRSWKVNFDQNELLLLLPHCLQNSTCPHKITNNPGNCRRCGGCQIGDILNMAFEKGVKVEIVTGGTLARRAVQKNRPRVVIAVACERDLSSGILDVFPLPVFGVLNERPEGPCYNTRVNLAALEEAIVFFLNNYQRRLA